MPVTRQNASTTASARNANARTNPGALRLAVTGDPPSRDAALPSLARHLGKVVHQGIDLRGLQALPEVLGHDVVLVAGGDLGARVEDRLLDERLVLALEDLA